MKVKLTIIDILIIICIVCAIGFAVYHMTTDNDNGSAVNFDSSTANKIRENYENRDENFGNGRDVRNFFEDVVVRPGHLQLAEEPRRVPVHDPQALLACAVADGRGYEGLAGAGASRDEDVLLLLDERQAGQPLHEVPVQSALA